MSDTAGSLPPVAVFESGLPPGLAIIRSLGRAGVPLRVYDDGGWVAGRHSRYTEDFAVSPPVAMADDFLAWLTDEMDRRGPALIAPTSDYIAYAAIEFEERTGIPVSGVPEAHRGRVMDCLFKDRFARVMDDIGFPTPPWSLPTNLEEATESAERLGYPVLLKPRSHIGLGIVRGEVAEDPAELGAKYGPAGIVDPDADVLRHDPDLDQPLLQAQVTGEAIDVLGITGYVDADGGVSGVDCYRKTRQWGGTLAIGVEFEAIEAPLALDHVLEAVAASLRAAIFEFELLVDATDGRYWAIEINPRAFGPVSLSVARGHDLPRLWYEGATGRRLAPARPPRRRPRRWRMGLPHYAGEAVQVLRGPDRLGTLGRLVAAPFQRTAASVHSWRDPRPGAAFTLKLLGSPGGLVRPYLDD